MANTGKNKLVRWARLFVGGYDLSADSVGLDKCENSMELVELTGWSDSVVHGLASQSRKVGIYGYQAYLNDTALSGAYTILKTPATRTVSLLFGGGAEPTYGDPAYIIDAAQINNLGSFESGSARFAADFIPHPAYYLTGSPLAVILSPNVARTATFNGTSHNNGAASTNGYHATMHIIASSGGTWAYTIEQSTTGAFAGEETTLATFTVNGSAVTGEYKSATGNVAQYLRARGVRTSGTCTVIICIARK